MAIRLYEPQWQAGPAVAKMPQGSRCSEFERVMAAIPAPAREQFSDCQLELLNAALEATSSRKRHSIDYRTSIPLLGARYYVAFLVGREQRSPDRLKSEGHSSLRRVGIAYLAALWLLTSVIAVTAVVCIYVVKSLAGIDLFDGPSPLHAFVFG